MNKIIIALITVLLFAAPSFAGTKLGYVNLQKALNDSKAGAEAKSKISAQAKEYETQFKIKQGDFLKLKRALEKQAALLSDSAKQEKILEYQKK